MNELKALMHTLHIDWIQCVVLIMGVTEVLLARANNVLLYPAGIIATTLSIYALFITQLYAESALNVYYLVMSIYGWWYWSGAHGEPTPVTFNTVRDWVTTLLIVCFSWIILYLCLSWFTTSDVPAWDAWVSATGWAGMWLLARRKVENWLLLNLSNAFAIPLFFFKDRPLFALLTMFLFMVACIGYVSWRKKAATRASQIIV